MGLGGFLRPESLRTPLEPLADFPPTWKASYPQRPHRQAKGAQEPVLTPGASPIEGQSSPDLAPHDPMAAGHGNQPATAQQAARQRADQPEPSSEGR